MEPTHLQQHGRAQRNSKLHVVTPLRTSFQVNAELYQDVEKVVRNAFERGQASGLRLARKTADKALGVGFCIGFACGVVVAVLVTGTLS